MELQYTLTIQEITGNNCVFFQAIAFMLCIQNKLWTLAPEFFVQWSSNSVTFSQNLLTLKL